MKKFLKSVVCVLFVCLVALPAAACDPAKPRDKTLTLTVSNLGFGTAWLDSIAQEFEKLYDVDVKIEPTVIAKDLLLQLENDYKLTDICLFAGVDQAWDTMRKGKFMQIDDVWATAPEGEDLTVSEKMIAEYRSAYKFNDHYWSMPFITELGGIAYNATTLNGLFGEGKWRLPKTTFELDALCEDIKNAGAYAFSWCNKENACYWGLPCSVWKAQYDGKMNTVKAHEARVYKPSDASADEDGYVLDMTGELLDMKGELRMLETVQKYVYSQNGYSHKYCTSMQFAEAQAAFAGIPYANDNKRVAFSPNGSWLYEENFEDFEYKKQDVGFMRVPIISALSEKLSYYADGDTDFNTLSYDKQARYDAALTAIVDYIEGGKTGNKPTEADGLSISDADIARVDEAYNIAYIKDQAHMFIPFNSQNPELAKKFMLFLCSDYAGEIYTTVTHGFFPTYVKINDNNAAYMHRFDRDVAAILNTSTQIITPDSRFNFGLKSVTAEEFFSSGQTYYGTPKESYENCYVKLNRDNWGDKLRIAGFNALAG